MLLYDAKRAFSVKWIYIGVLLTVAITVFIRLDSIMEVVRNGEFLESGWTQEFLLDTLSDEAMLFFLPVLCSIPYSSSFTDELKSGITKFTFCRIKRMVYLRSKVVATALSGGCVLTVGALVVIMMANIIFLPLESMSVTEAEAVQEVANPYMRLLFRYFCFGVLGSVTGLWISTRVNNRFLAWTAPFMVEYLLIIFYERYFTWCIVLYPKEWLQPSENWPLDGLSAPLWMLCLSLFAAWAFIHSAERRLLYV